MPFRPLFALVFFTFLLLVSCSTSSSSSDDTTPGSTMTESSKLQEAPDASDDCSRCDSVSKIIDEYGVNPIRAQDTYTGERIRIRGKIKSLDERKWSSSPGLEAGRSISVALDNGIGFGFQNMDSRTGDDAAWYDWRNWLLSKNVGDEIEAECTIKMLASAERHPDRVPGTPIINDCNRVVDGIVIVTPTP